MKKGITIWSAAQLFSKGEMTVKSFIEYSAGIGFEGVDLGYFWQDKEKEFKELPRYLEDNGIALSGYIVGNNFGAVVGTGREQEEIDKVRLAIDETRALGADKLRVFAGGREGLAWEEGSKMVLDCFVKCTEYAEKNEVRLALEDHHGLAGNSKEVLFYIKKIDSPFFGATVDIGNFLFAGEEPAAGVKNTAPYALMVHVKDFRRDGANLQAAVVGEGVVDIKECFKIIKESGYEGYLALEYEAKEECRTGIKKSFIHMEKCLGEI